MSSCTTDYALTMARVLQGEQLALVLFHTTDLDFCGAREPEKSAQLTTETARKHSGCSRARWAKARLCFVKGH